MRNLAKVVTVSKEWELAFRDKVHGVAFNELGYEAMVSKDIRVGNRVIFIQEGAILPETPTWEMLRKMGCYNESEKGFVIKVKKFKDIRSWGLCLKPEECGLTEEQISTLKSGDDVTDILNIRKYEPSEGERIVLKKEDSRSSCFQKFVKFCMKHSCLRWLGKCFLYRNKRSVEDFPTRFISKSDETTIENCKEELILHSNDEIYVTLKMEGKSATYLYDTNGKNKPNVFKVCSRNHACAVPSEDDYWYVARKYNLKEKIMNYYKKTGRLLVIQGEICGEGIQCNIYRFKGKRFFVYTIKDAVTGKQFSFPELLATCYELNLETVPVLTSYIKLHDLFPTINACTRYTENLFFKVYREDDVQFHYVPFKNEKLWKDFAQHEGIVVRSINYDKTNCTGTSFKVKNIDYAEKGINEISKIKWEECTERILNEKNRKY